MKKMLMGFVLGLVLGITIMGVSAISNVEKKPSDYRIGYSYTYSISQDKPVIVLFYTDWCTACRNFMPVYKLLYEIYSNSYGFAMVNCEDKMNQKYIDEYNIEFFPSVYIVDKKGKQKTFVDLEKCYDVNGLKEFLDKYMNNKAENIVSTQ